MRDATLCAWPRRSCCRRTRRTAFSPRWTRRWAKWWPASGKGRRDDLLLLDADHFEGPVRHLGLPFAGELRTGDPPDHLSLVSASSEGDGPDAIFHGDAGDLPVAVRRLENAGELFLFCRECQADIHGAARSGDRADPVPGELRVGSVEAERGGSEQYEGGTQE